jgi:hypothetical protein
MTQQLEAMKLALEALEANQPVNYCMNNNGEKFPMMQEDPFRFERNHKAITSLRQAIEQAQKQEPVAWESILGAVARGWCYEENANKTMDLELAVAIAKEVQALFTSPPQRQPDHTEDNLEMVEKQEPVAWRFRSGTWFNREAHWRYINTLEGADGLRGLEPLYTSPPQRQWVGLTDEEMQAVVDAQPLVSSINVYFKAIEAKLKEKNS